MKQVVPKHYGTFPALTGTPQRLRQLVEPRGVKVLELKPGETLASLIEMAGGFTAAADRRTVQIDRIIPPAERKNSGSDRLLVGDRRAPLIGGGAQRKESPCFGRSRR